MEYHYVHTLILNSLRWYNCISPLCEYDSYVVGLITEIRNGVSIRKKYSHAREYCFRVYLASKFGTWVTVDDSACDITAFLSRHCFVRIQPGTALGFSVIWPSLFSYVQRLFFSNLIANQDPPFCLLRVDQTQMGLPCILGKSPS